MGGIERLEPAHLRAVVLAYRDALRAHQERLNRLNVYPVPDGDTGTNMALTIESVVAELGDDDHLASLCSAISHGSLMGARGNSGVILSQVLRGLAGRLSATEVVDATALAEGLTAASEAAYQAVMRPVEGTILTVVREAAEAARTAAGRPGATLVAVLDAAGEAGACAPERTPEQLPVLAEAGVVDAGGAGFVLLLDVLLHVAAGRPVPEPASEPDAAAAASSRAAEQPGGATVDGHAAGDLRYEVMFLLEAPDEALPGFKQAWSAVGDSIVVVGGDGLWNCHIHTNDIGAAIEAAVDAGRPRRIQVTDLAEQVEEERWVRDGLGPPANATEAKDSAAEDAEERARAVTGVVAVGAGDGVARAFRSLGADRVVAGGQSMNPSTAELLAAVEAVPAEAVLLLPNNKNVIPVAERVPELASKPVRVVPTRDVVQGVAALVAYDAKADADVNRAAMGKAAAEVVAGEVTWAVRDSSGPAGPIREGDYLGMADDDVVVVDADLGGAACALLGQLVQEHHELVTVIEGERATAETTDRICSWLGEHRPGAEVEVQSWGQPLSAYLFSIE